MNEVIEQSLLKSLLTYDKDTGLFKKIGSSGGVSDGAIIGSLTLSGYVQTSILGKRVLCHRLAWLYVTGSFPKFSVDHINGIKNDNRFSNLREATQEENLKNMKISIKNTSGYKGVSFSDFSGRFRARARIAGKHIHLGYFNTAELASAAYQNFSKDNHGNFYRNTEIKGS